MLDEFAPYPTRMAVARLQDGSAWVWSPIALTAKLAGAVESVGAVRHIVSPNKIHRLLADRSGALCHRRHTGFERRTQ
jgi:hypothetical protein